MNISDIKEGERVPLGDPFQIGAIQPFWTSSWWHTLRGAALYVGRLKIAEVYLGYTGQYLVLGIFNKEQMATTEKEALQLCLLELHRFLGEIVARY